MCDPPSDFEVPAKAGGIDWVMELTPPSCRSVSSLVLLSAGT